MTMQRNHFPTPINQMGPWDFWSTVRALGLSSADAGAIDDGSATLDQQSRAHAASSQAREKLIAMVPGLAVVVPVPARMRLS